MAKPVRTSDMAKALCTAIRIADIALPPATEEHSLSSVELHAATRNAVLPVLLRELLDNEYVDDLA